MRAIILMFDSLNRHLLPPYADTVVDAPNFARLAAKAVTFDNFYAGSMPCMPARREMHTGRYNFLHRSWGPLEPFDDSMPELLGAAGVHTHLVSDHPHYWEDGGGTYHTRYTTWEFFRGQEGDPWKGVVDGSAPGDHAHARMLFQDQVNRRYMSTEAEHSQTRTVDAGMEFLQTNAEADRWLLQLELFDPHEPFFAAEPYRARYAHDNSADRHHSQDAHGPAADWPGYGKVTEPSERVEQTRTEYAALVSQCDHSLGRVLDFMDAHDMWSDTLLLVNTDHGFLLGEHGWWAKSVMPWFNELVHIPMFLWDPRTGDADTRRGALAQTIDIAPTMLGYFGLEPTPDMQGHDLATVLATADREVREGALFGIHGGHVNVTDGRFVYLRAPADPANAPLEEYTLMPTHMRGRFSVEELTGWEPAEPMPFTKGLQTMRMDVVGGWLNPWQHGTLLFDLESDPGQKHPIVDDEQELRMLGLLAQLMHTNDAPRSQFDRLGIPFEDPVGVQHLLVRAQAERAAAIAEPLLATDQLPAAELLRTPLAVLLGNRAVRTVLDDRLPGFGNTELVTAAPRLSLLDLARVGTIAAGTLRAIADDLASQHTD